MWLLYKSFHHSVQREQGSDLVEVDHALAVRAGELAEVRRLRGYDAVHLAAGERVRDPDVVVIAGDGALLDAAAAEGMAVAALP